MFRTARAAQPSRRRVLLPVACAVAAALALSGCAAGQISQTADQVAAIDGANGDAGKIGVRNALLATPDNPNGLDKGSDARLLVYVSNDSTADDTLSSVSSPAAASVQISGTAAVPAQALTNFAADDSKVTITLKGLTQAVGFGQSVPVTFTFATAGAVTVNVPIAIPVERSGERSAIDIMPPEATPVWHEGESGH